jgi:hypothetical protein
VHLLNDLDIEAHAGDWTLESGNWVAESVINCDETMSKEFDIGLETLTGNAAARQELGQAAERGPARMPDHLPDRGTFFLETFGCQMNDHDSEKVAGVLMSRGYRQVEKLEAASVIFYNTCSIREKAAQKVFSRLGEFREKQHEGKIIGVLGCVAQQEGEDIFKRAPWVNLVCGSASYRKLPEMLARLENGDHRVTGLDNDTDETFETPVTRRDNPWRAYLTIIEGCLLVLRGAVHAGAGAQPVERGDSARSARIGWYGVHGSATAGADGEFVRGSHGGEGEIFGAAAGGGGGAGHPAGAVYYVASARFWTGYCGCDRCGAKALRACAFAGAVGVDAGAAGDAADVYAR